MASLFGNLMGGGGGASSAAVSIGTKTGLFKPSNIMNTVTDAVKGKAGRELNSIKANVVGGQGGKIDWTVYNWPSRLEVLSIIHFDLAELKEKRDINIYNMTRYSYWWWLSTMFISGINFLDTCILVTLLDPVYPGYTIVFSLIWWLVWTSMGMSCVYFSYHGIVEGSIRSKLISKVLGIILMILSLIHIFGHFGNINGIAAFSGTQFTIARNTNGVASESVSYWEAVTAIESLLWLGNGTALGWFIYRIFKGPSNNNNVEALPK